MVSGFDNYGVTSVTRATLASLLATGEVMVPCGAQAAIGLALGVPAVAPGPCVPADQITAKLAPTAAGLALIPPALVTPRVKVVALEGADLFGERPARAAAYPLVIPTPTGWPAAWTDWQAGDVRVIVTTGVNCPDRGVSHQTVILGRGWDWLLRGGTARYTGTHWDPAFGWTVVDAVRTGHAGAIRDLIANADVAVSDFECAMTHSFVQHDSGTVFSIDPRVAPLMARAGFDVATVAADHNTNAGLAAVGETVDLFRANGIQPTGGGRTLARGPPAGDRPRWRRHLRVRRLRRDRRVCLRDGDVCRGRPAHGRERPDSRPAGTGAGGAGGHRAAAVELGRVPRPVHPVPA